MSPQQKQGTTMSRPAALSSFSHSLRAFVPSCLCALFISILSGCAPSFLVTPVSSSQSLREITVEDGGGAFGGSKVVIIEVEGMLLNAKSGGFLQAQENDVSLFAQQLQKAEHDSAVKALVFR